MTGRSSDRLLDSYMQEREPHVRQTILTAMGLGRIICERDPKRALERDARLRAAQGGVIKTESRQNMIPNLQHGLIAGDTALAGSLFPQPRVHAGSFTGLLDDLTGARTRVVCAARLPADVRHALLEELAPLGGVLVELVDAGRTSGDGPALAVTEEAPLLGPWLQVQGLTAAVIRPDHYVYGTATDPAGGLDLLRRFNARLA